MNGHLTDSNIKDISDSLSDMERQVIIRVRLGIAWCGFSDVTERLAQMGLLSKDNIHLSSDGYRVFNTIPGFLRY